MKLFDNLFWLIYKFIKYDIRYSHLRIYWFFQRGIRGWSDKDVRCLDIYLATIIRDTTKHLKNNCKEIPYGYDECEWKDDLKFIAKTYNTYLNIVNDKHGIYLKYVKRFGKKTYITRWNKLKHDMLFLINIFEKI